MVFVFRFLVFFEGELVLGREETGEWVCGGVYGDRLGWMGKEGFILVFDLALHVM